MMLSMQASSVQGGSEFKLSGEGLGTGTMEGVILDDGTVVLERGNSSLDNWTEMSAGYPAAREEPYFIYDSHDEMLALFGGMPSASGLNDGVWLYSLSRNRWYEPPANGSRMYQAMNMAVYDSWHDVIVVFGGYGRTNDTSVYNVSAREWRSMHPPTSPPARSYSAMAFDDRNGLCVLFGGEGDMRDFNDTWTYNLTANEWTEMKPITAPSPRRDMLMAYDKAAGVIVLHSGTTASGGDHGDTWLYNTTNNTWWRVLSTGGPGSHANTMAYDDAEKMEIVFLDGSSSIATYNVTANAWTYMNPPSKPPVYHYRGMGYDIANGAVVITGGFTRDANDDVVMYDDIWCYNLSRNAWKQVLKPKELPSPRHSHAMVFDESSGKAVMFGGENSSSSRYQLADTWTYDLPTNTWTLEYPAKSPPARRAHGMVYCAGPNVTVLFGGNTYPGNTHFNDTWTYSTATGTWKDMRPSDAPSSQDGPGMAYDESHGVVVLLTDGHETWTYNVSSNTWRNMAPTAFPTDRYEYKLAYDRAHDTIVAVLGCDNRFAWFRRWNYSDVWTYDVDANTWTNRSPSRSPLWRSGYSLAYDSARGETVMFGGSHSEWNGSTWLPRDDGFLWRFNLSTDAWTSESLPPGLMEKSSCPIVYIDGSQSMVTFGGTSSNRSFMGDTWAFNVVAYAPEGTYLSPQHDTGGTSYFGTLDWTADVTPDTYLGLQLRTAGTRDGLNITPFVGPDGTSTTSYEAPGAWIASEHNASRWLQYRALLRTWDPMATPSLHEVAIEYNRLHDLTLLSPLGGENWTGRHDIEWDATDSDNDTLAFDILIVNPSITFKVASDLPNGTTSWQWDIQQSFYGLYCITVVARDANPKIPLTVSATSGPVALNHHAPLVELVSPGHLAEVNTTDVDLVWNATDEDGDLLECHVFLSTAYFSPQNLPPPIAVGSEDTYRLTGLHDGTIYYWTVLANDGHVNSTVPAVRSFRVTLPPPPNHPPAVVLLSPEDGAVLDREPVTLSWSGTDEDGDALAYSILIRSVEFGPGNLPEPFETTIATTIDLTGLVDGNTYYWTVIVTDGDYSVLGNGIWNFTLSLPQPNHPPTATLAFPLDGEEVANTTVTLQWADHDEDGDQVSNYLFLSDFPFTPGSLPPRLAIVGGTEYVATDLTNGTTYFWTVVPNDGKVNGTALVVWSFTVRVPSPPPPVNHAPRISGPAHAVVTAGQVLRAKVNATDDDGDPLAFGLLPAGLGIALDSSTGELVWQTALSDEGNHTITVNVSDGRGGSDSLSMVIEVRAPSPPPPTRWPTCAITAPTNGSRFWAGRGGTINITGTAVNGSRPLERVQIRIDGGQWLDARGYDRWWLSVDIKSLKVGAHRVEARAFDGVDYSDIAVVEFEVRPMKQSVGPSFGLMILLVIAVAIALALVLLARRFRDREAL